MILNTFYNLLYNIKNYTLGYFLIKNDFDEKTKLICYIYINIIY